VPSVSRYSTVFGNIYRAKIPNVNTVKKESFIPGVPQISVFTGSKHIEPSFEACARPKSAICEIGQHME
jgi:hypothetical protein